MKVYYVFYLFCIFLTSCSFNKEIKFDKIEHIKCILSQDSSLIGTPLEMKLINPYLLISDFRGDSMLWIYNIERNKMIKREMPIGIGPEEYQPPIQILLLDENIVNIYNRWHYNWNLFEFNTSNALFQRIQERKSISTDIDMLLPITNCRYIASGRFKDGRYAILDSIGNITNYCGDYPSFLPGEESIDNFPRFMFHQSQFAYNKENNYILSVTSHVLDILKDTINTPILKKRILLSPYKYKYQYGDDWASAQRDKNTERGVVRVDATNKYIYLLYNPNTMQTKESETKKNEIWIFNWKGEPIKKIIPDYTIDCFCVDEWDNVIYCIVEAPEPTIAKMNIRSSIKK